MTSHGQPVEALAHAGETVLRTESVKSVDRRTETNCGSKTLNQRQQHIGAAAGEDSGHGETSLDQHLLETEVETAEAWATYLAECFDTDRLIQHAGEEKKTSHLQLANWAVASGGKQKHLTKHKRDI